MGAAALTSPVQDASPLISAQGVSLKRGGRDLLHHISLDVRPREIVTLIGPNGAGKTTLVKLMLGIIRPDAGEITRSSNLRIGYVPQYFSLDPTMPLTVRRFLSLNKPGYRLRRMSRKALSTNGSRDEAIMSALQETGMEHAIGAQLNHLSGGEFQRVALARALVDAPDLLVLDEPVQGVDYAGEADLYNLIAKLRDARGCGILLVSHDLHVVLGASDRVICINQHICCSGMPDQVAQHPEYARLFGAEAARAYGIYRHHHDHEHDLSGNIAARSLPQSQSQTSSEQ